MLATPRFALAALALLAAAGCQQPPATPPVVGPALQVSLSQPGSLRGALRVALQHLDRLPANAEPYHLVRFRGEHLDGFGRSVPAAGSGWTFTFSRYTGPAPAADYQTAEIGVPGTGYTTIYTAVSTDAALSPIEGWDALLAGAGQDSDQLLAPMRAKGVETNGATLAFAQGLVTIQAGGKSTTYKTLDGASTPIQ